MPPERLERWVAGFFERHGGAGGSRACSVVPDGLQLAGGDGAVAEMETPWPPADLGRPDPVTALAAHAAQPRTALLVLVRRGGFGAAIARDGELLAHAVGTRYVQGRTAAGGWSQQRFARRRSGQAATLVGNAVEAVLKVLASDAGMPDVLVPGGDRRLVDEVLSDVRLRHVTQLPRGPLLDVRDPRLVVLQDVAQRARAVRVRVTEPAPGRRALGRSSS